MMTQIDIALTIQAVECIITLYECKEISPSFDGYIFHLRSSHQPGTCSNKMSDS